MNSNSLLSTAKELGLPWDVVLIITQFAADWMLRHVQKHGGTPSRLGLLPFKIEIGAYSDTHHRIWGYCCESRIDVEWLGRYTVDEPLSCERDTHWIRADSYSYLRADNFCRLRSWNYGSADYDSLKPVDNLIELWYQCEPCLR